MKKFSWVLFLAVASSLTVYGEPQGPTSDFPEAEKTTTAPAEPATPPTDTAKPETDSVAIPAPDATPAADQGTLGGGKPSDFVKKGLPLVDGKIDKTEAEVAELEAKQKAKGLTEEEKKKLEAAKEAVELLIELEDGMLSQTPKIEELDKKMDNILGKDMVIGAVNFCRGKEMGWRRIGGNRGPAESHGLDYLKESGAANATAAVAAEAKTASRVGRWGRRLRSVFVPTVGHQYVVCLTIGYRQSKDGAIQWPDVGVTILGGVQFEVKDPSEGAEIQQGISFFLVDNSVKPASTLRDLMGIYTNISGEIPEKTNDKTKENRDTDIYTLGVDPLSMTFKKGNIHPSFGRYLVSPGSMNVISSSSHANAQFEVLAAIVILDFNQDREFLWRKFKENF